MVEGREDMGFRHCMCVFVFLFFGGVEGGGVGGVVCGSACSNFQVWVGGLGFTPSSQAS